MKHAITAILVLIFMNGGALFAAVGCDLNDPDRDVKRLFPGSTGYKTVYLSLDRVGGQGALARVEERLGDRFTGLYETADVPYTVYEIYRGREKIGYIHGVNQKGTYGGIQVFLSLGMDGVIRNFYFQKLTSREASVLRGKSFGAQFAGLSLRHFYAYDVKSGTAAPGSGVSAIRNPAPSAERDFRATLRAAKKNLILMDEFVFGNRHLVYFKGGGGGK